MLSWDVPINFTDICFSGHTLCVQLAEQGNAIYWDKSLEFLHILKRKGNFKESAYGRTIDRLTRCIISEFMQNKLSGSKFSQSMHVEKLIGEALQYPSCALFMKVTRYFEYVTTNNKKYDQVLMIEFAEELFVLVQKLKPEDGLTAEYLEAKIDVLG